MGGFWSFGMSLASQDEELCLFVLEGIDASFLLDI